MVICTFLAPLHCAHKHRSIYSLSGTTLNLLYTTDVRSRQPGQSIGSEVLPSSDAASRSGQSSRDGSLEARECEGSRPVAHKAEEEGVAAVEYIHSEVDMILH